MGLHYAITVKDCKTCVFRVHAECLHPSEKYPEGRAYTTEDITDGEFPKWCPLVQTIVTRKVIREKGNV